MNDAPITCPDCNGEKTILGFFPVYSPSFKGERKPVIEMKCPTCEGAGEITALQMAWREQGEQLRKRRIELGYGLREFAELVGMKPSDWSYMEQGKAKPEWPANAPLTPTP